MRYRPVITPNTTRRPEAFTPDGATLVEHLVDLDGVCYATVADSVDIAQFSAEFECERPDLTPEQRGRIKRLAPRARLIKRRAEARISERYSLEDRLQIAAIAGGISNGLVEETPGYRAMMEAYRDYVVSVNQWAAAEYGRLGL